MPRAPCAPRAQSALAFGSSGRADEETGLFASVAEEMTGGAAATASTFVRDDVTPSWCTFGSDGGSFAAPTVTITGSAQRA
jgi:hypothetical protein